jgi:DNA-binding MarR family transcriptional regulator
VDFDDEAIQQAVAFGLAWRDLRRAPRVTAMANLVVDGGPPLESGEIDTLDQIAWTSPCQMHEIASGLQVDASTATRAVDRLIRRGLVERARDPDDGRFVSVWITSEGRRVHSALLARRLEFVASVLDQFDDADRQALLRLLPALADVVSTMLRSSSSARGPE